MGRHALYRDLRECPVCGEFWLCYESSTQKTCSSPCGAALRLRNGTQGAVKARPENSEIVSTFLSGVTPSDIARSVGVSRERVRQILYADLGESRVRFELEKQAAVRQKARVALLVESAQCVVCHGEFTRNRCTQPRRTCSTDCAKVWMSPAKYRLDGRRRRQAQAAMARYTLAHPERPDYSAKKNWAERILAEHESKEATA